VSDTKLALLIDTPELSGSLSWNALESLMVAMSHQLPAQYGSRTSLPDLGFVT